MALRKWAVHDLPGNTEVGLVAANESTATRLRGLSPLQSTGTRDLVASNIPYTPGDSRTPACLSCGIRQAHQVYKTTLYYICSDILIVNINNVDVNTSVK